MYNLKKTAAVRIDDYLDLYNYAGTIGDVQWQHDLIARLSQITHPENAANGQTLPELLHTFDQVNISLMRLYGQLHKAESKEEADLLWAEVWELKNLRIQLMQTLYPEIHGNSLLDR
ncbi:hypothetical protein [Gorillibacterium massiliense]|uniref:hypothetical protein n=1 Tax=Gorillibacterium massiliense TaxID=1280390 RepID=UPI0004B85675|nr:hypothetical protein [Gorillibacterium massiliense]